MVDTIFKVYNGDIHTVTTHSLPDRIDFGTTALVVVDAQNAFAAPDSPLADDGVDLSNAINAVPRVQTLLETSREAGLTVSFTRSLRRPDAKDAPQNVYDIIPGIYESGDPICCAGQPDAQYVSGITPQADEYEVTKTRYNGFHGTDLEYILRAGGIETVLLCGFTTNVCVESTARGAHERGFNVVLVEDCCASFSEDEHRAAVRNVDRLLGTTVTLHAIVDNLRSAGKA